MIKEINLLKEIKNTEEYKNALKNMSDEEKKLVEKATENIIKDFEEKILNPLKNLLNK